MARSHQLTSLASTIPLSFRKKLSVLVAHKNIFDIFFPLHMAEKRARGKASVKAAFLCAAKRS